MQKNYHTDNKSFMVYKEWEEYMEMLSDEEAGRLFRALFAFASRGEETDFSGTVKMLFAVMRNTLDRDGKKWEEVCIAHSRRKPKAANETNETNETNANDKDKEKDIEKDIEEEKEPPKGRRAVSDGGVRRSAAKNKKSVSSEHSYDLDKLIEHALNYPPKLP